MKLVALRSVGCSMLFVCCLVPLVTQAALTPLSPAPGSEPDLIGPGGFLDAYIGLDNLIRIDDDNDRVWQNQGAITVTAIGKWAGFTHEFGIIDAADLFIPLIEVGRWGQPGAVFGSNDSGSLFNFGLDPGGAPLWSSNPGANADSLDHMVTWQIDAGPDNELTGAFVIAWEDLYAGGDRDFNDLILLVSGDAALAPIPLPAAVWLLASGALALGALARRQSRG